jgi:aspartokinase/homoserine dehydrogenase 1
MRIIKFGGSSVANAARIQSVIEILKPYWAKPVGVVFSAFGGVTDQLIQLSQQALAGQSYKELLDSLEKRHLDTVRELVQVTQQSSVLAQVKIQLNELEDVLHGVFLVKECSPRTLDYIMSFGERLSAFIIARALQDKGQRVSFLDARTVIRTNSDFGSAKVDFAVTNQQIQTYFTEHPEPQIITGFIGATLQGETTTLGRSGSDYTAAIFAGALQAEALEIWTDVDGMLTADPRLVKKAFPVPEMTYEEAMELSHFGAKVVFPATMQPAMAHNIPIWIKNTFNPGHPGTCIYREARNGKLIKGISSVKNISLLNITGSGLVGVVGVSSRVFSTLALAKVNVVLISQASSEHSICIAIETSAGERAKAALEHEFRNEIRDAQMDVVAVTRELAIVAVVGDGMQHQAGSSGRMFNALGKNGINVIAIAQGSSERNISAVILESDVSKALNVLHDAFFLSDRKTIHLFLAGTGLIGMVLLQQIAQQKEKLAEEGHLELRLIALANSRKMFFHLDGIDYAHAVPTLKSQGASMNLAHFIQQIVAANLPNSIFVDCTASQAVADVYPSLLSANISIVTPNKKANSASLEKYHALKALTRQRGVKFLYETNVGAGLPVINTLNDLLVSGDKILRIEAVLSGTLNFIFSSFTEGRAFSEVVREAKEKGYTEPDPRDDLSGLDVARKILILARETGLAIELEDIPVENLVPADCREIQSLDGFFQQLATHDAAFEKLRSAAAANGEKLRYQAVLEDGKVQVALKTVGAQHPFYSLAGSDNIILLTTERYHERPMVIRGPGAGAAVTAAGVFADLIRIGNYANG